MNITDSNIDIYTTFQILISIFSSTNYTRSEFYLITSLIDSLAENSNLSIEELANVSGVSPASISRFVKKNGFKNYSDFRVRLTSLLEVSYAVRKSKYGHLDALDTAPIFDNINSTKDSIDIEKIHEILNYILSFKKCLFVGSVEDLSTFSSFRKDLFTCKKACYLFYDLETQLTSIEAAQADTCIILPTVSDRHIPHYLEAIKKARQNGTGAVLFSQGGSDQVESLFDYVYIYGSDNADNYGLHSLLYLSYILISELHTILSQR